MATKERKVSFYHLSQERQAGEKPETIEPTDVERHFVAIYEGMEKLANNRCAKRIDIDGMQAVVEVIAYNAEQHDAFLRVGYQNQPNNTALRNQETLVAEKIKVKKNQMVELYTCCYIDFTTCIVSYIGLVSAPRVRALKILFDQELENAGITSTFSVILHPAVIDDLKNKRVTSLEISIATPGDDVLSDVIDMGAEDFDALKNIKRATCTYKMSAERLKSIFDTPDAVSGFYNNVKKSCEDMLLKFRVTVKENGADERIIDLVQENMTYPAKIEIDDGHALDDDGTNLTALKSCYVKEKTKLKQYLQK